MHGNFKHGYTSKDRIYRIWHNMKTRCYNKNHERYYCYGGKGVKVCDEWINDFIAFRDWAYANGYSDNLTIDRIDNNGPYSPDNCRWVTPYVQSNNMSTNVFYTYDGMTLTQKCWDYALGIPYKFTHAKIKSGYTFDQVVEEAREKDGINGIYFLNEYGLPYRPQDDNPYEKEE